MALRARRKANLDGFSLADLLIVLRVAQHCEDPAAVDASWRILATLFPLEALVEAFEDKMACAGAPDEKKH
jgi:hypothetical protein